MQIACCDIAFEKGRRFQGRWESWASEIDLSVKCRIDIAAPDQFRVINFQTNVDRLRTVGIKLNSAFATDATRSAICRCEFEAKCLAALAREFGFDIFQQGATKEIFILTI